VVVVDGLVESAQLPEVRRPPWQGLLRSTFLRFLVVGGVSYVVNQTLLFALYEGGLRRLASLGGLNTGLLLASVLALEASVLVRFAMNDRWTFGAHHAKPFRQRLAQSNLSAAGGTAIALAGVNLLTPLLGINYLLANSIGIAFGLAWNWIWSTRVVWRPVAVGK
jgi:putative flippase GtrA